MANTKNIVFDVVGTLVGYEKMFEAIDARLGDRLRAEGIKPTLLGYCWIEVAEREYTYLSMSGSYQSYAKIFEAIFWRMLYKAGIEEPRKFANSDDLACIMDGYMRMEMRPGAKECILKLRDADFTVWAFTMGDLRRVGGYFANCGVNMPAENLLSCDTNAVGKPDPEAYKPLLKRLSGYGKEIPWFAAGHMWDVSAAKRTGCVSEYLDKTMLTLHAGSRVRIVRSGRVSRSRSFLVTWTYFRILSLRWPTKSLLHRDENGSVMLLCKSGKIRTKLIGSVMPLLILQDQS